MTKNKSNRSNKRSKRTTKGASASTGEGPGLPQDLPVENGPVEDPLELDPYPPTRWPTNGVYLSPYTAGGDALVVQKRLNVTEAVINQTHKSLNKRLWELYHIDKSVWAVKDIGASARSALLETHVSFTTSQLSSTIADHSVDQICQLMVLLHDTRSEASALFDISHAPSPKKSNRKLIAALDPEHIAPPFFTNDSREHRLDPVAVTLEKTEVSMMKGIDNMREWPAAFLDSGQGLAVRLRMSRYNLYEMLPWHASPVVFTGKQAFELGVAQLHSAHLFDSAVLCMDLGKYDCDFYRRAAQFANLLIEMRYISHATLIKAIRLHLEAQLRLASRSPKVPKPHLDNTRELLARMERKAVNPDAWAHEHCVTVAHEGCV